MSKTKEDSINKDFNDSLLIAQSEIEHAIWRLESEREFLESKDWSVNQLINELNKAHKILEGV